MKISIIIPTYNDQENLKKTLSAILNSNYKPYEVIVVDDASTDKTKEEIEKIGFKYIKLEKNSGQATARNTGAKIAKGDILFFIDSDIMIKKDTLEQIDKAYKNPEIMVYQGVTSKKPLNKGFGPELMALKWYHTLSKERKASFVYSHVFSIRKEVFNEFGGFNQKFRPPGAGEEFDLGIRLRKKYILHTDPQLIVEQGFPGILRRAYYLYKRAYVWASLFSKTKKFEKTNATLKEALIGIFDILTIIFLVLSIFNTLFLYPFISFFLIQTILNSSFYLFILKEKGLLFLFRSISPTVLWSIAQIFGATNYYIKKIFGLVK